MIKLHKFLKMLSVLKFTFLAVTSLLLVGVVLYIIHTHDFKKAVSGKIPSTPAKTLNPASSSPADKPASTSPTSSVTVKYQPQTDRNNKQLTIPNGTFVSNHQLSLSGSEAQKSEHSTCNTNPGASCYIKFEQGSAVRTLATQNTDSSGSTVWDWNISSSGLTVGTWKVTATASLNGSTQTVQDPINLEVQP